MTIVAIALKKEILSVMI